MKTYTYASNSSITVVYMTSGDAANLRETEARKAADVLGVKDLVFLRNPDGYYG